MLRPEPVSSLRRAWRGWQSSLASLPLRRARAVTARGADAEPVRHAMNVLAANLPGPAAPRLAMAIATRRDVAGLWHLRVALMQALAAADGEAVARRRIADLDAVFLRAWPGAPVTRRVD